MKPQTYKDDRPAEYFDQFHERPRRRGRLDLPFVRILISLPTLLLWRVRAIGVENVPKSGPLLLAPNHFSQMDHFFTGLYLRRKVRFMAKSQIFGPPVLTYVFAHGGVFPVRRGHHDEEAFKTAYPLLDQGEMLLIYAEGGRSRSGELRRAESRNRAARARIRRPRGPRRDPRLGLCTALEALHLPEGDRRSSVSRSASRSSPVPAASGNSRLRLRSSAACGRCTPVSTPGKLHANSTRPEKNAHGSFNLPPIVGAGGREQG